MNKQILYYRIVWFLTLVGYLLLKNHQFPIILNKYLNHLNLEIKIYRSVIISNLPKIILADIISFDITSRSNVVTPTVSPVFERVDEVSNNASMKLLLLRKDIDIALKKETIINNTITKTASLKALSENNNDIFLLEL